MSYDYCYCDSYSYPYSEERRKAKKEHKCGECGRTIKPGEKYWYATGLCEGDWFDAKVCAQCEDMYNFVKAHVPCLCVSFGNQHGELIACAGKAGREAPGLYFGTLRRYVRVMKMKTYP